MIDNIIVLDIDDKTKAMVEDAATLHLLATSSIHVNIPANRVDEKANDCSMSGITKAPKGKVFDWKYYLVYGVARFK